MGRGIVIIRVGGKLFRKGRKTRISFPAMTSGRISRTYISTAAAKAAIKELPNFQRNRVIITLL